MKLRSSTVILLFLLFLSDVLVAQDGYKSKIVKTPHGDFTFAWKIEGNNLAVKAQVKTSGWMGVGFNGQASMAGAKLIIGKVDKDGKSLVAPFFGSTATQPEPVKKLGGKIDITGDSVKRTGELMELSFVTPMKASDKFGYTIKPDKVYVLISYADDNNFKQKHTYRHAFAINLITGK